MLQKPASQPRRRTAIGNIGALSAHTVSSSICDLSAMRAVFPSPNSAGYPVANIHKVCQRRRVLGSLPCSALPVTVGNSSGRTLNLEASVDSLVHSPPVSVQVSSSVLVNFEASSRQRREFTEFLRIRPSPRRSTPGSSLAPVRFVLL